MRQNTTTDGKWIRAYLDGDERAFAKIYRKYEKPLFSFILRFAGDRASAEDLFQQTWMKAIAALEEYEERGLFSGWLFGIAYRCGVDHTRKIAKERNDENSLDALPGTDPDPEEALLKKEERDRLHLAIDRLPADQKEVVLMRISAGLQFKEIARILECPLNTVLGRMHYAMAALKKNIDPSTEEVGNVLS